MTFILCIWVVCLYRTDGIIKIKKKIENSNIASIVIIIIPILIIIIIQLLIIIMIICIVRQVSRHTLPLLAFKILAVISAVPFLMDTVRDWLLARDAIIQWKARDCGVKSAAVQHSQRQRDRQGETEKGGGEVDNNEKPADSQWFFKLYLHAPYLIQPR